MTYPEYVDTIDTPLMTWQRTSSTSLCHSIALSVFASDGHIHSGIVSSHLS